LLLPCVLVLTIAAAIVIVVFCILTFPKVDYTIVVV